MDAIIMDTDGKKRIDKTIIIVRSLVNLSIVRIPTIMENPGI